MKKWRILAIAFGISNHNSSEARDTTISVQSETKSGWHNILWRNLYLQASDSLSNFSFHFFYPRWTKHCMVGGCES